MAYVKTEYYVWCDGYFTKYVHATMILIFSITVMQAVNDDTVIDTTRSWHVIFYDLNNETA